jgi:hypothetical protein
MKNIFYIFVRIYSASARYVMSRDLPTYGEYEEDVPTYGEYEEDLLTYGD